MSECLLIEFQTTNKNRMTYHLASFSDGLVLCGRRLRPAGVRRTLRRSVKVAVRRVATFDVPGGRGGINGCSQCHAKAHTLLDAVTRLGDLA